MGYGAVTVCVFFFFRFFTGKGVIDIRKGKNEKEIHKWWKGKRVGKLAKEKYCYMAFLFF